MIIDAGHVAEGVAGSFAATSGNVEFFLNLSFAKSNSGVEELFRKALSKENMLS
jgi:hypothetical protein